MVNYPTFMPRRFCAFLQRQVLNSRMGVKAVLSEAKRIQEHPAISDGVKEKLNLAGGSFLGCSCAVSNLSFESAHTPSLHDHPEPYILMHMRFLCSEWHCFDPGTLERGA